MATVKVKFRASSVPGKEGHNSYKNTQIYLQSIDVATINEANKRILLRDLERVVNKSICLPHP